MSQIDRLHYLPTFVWVLVLFLIWYIFIISFLLPIYYKTLRTRYLYEKKIWLNIKKKEYILHLIDVFYSIWIFTILKNFKLYNIVLNVKNHIFLGEIKSIVKPNTDVQHTNVSNEVNSEQTNKHAFGTYKHMSKRNILRFYQENLDEIGYVFKVSDDIVYARGLLKVQMSEMVRFEKEGENIFGIVNYLDNEGVVGITVLGDASKITAQTVVNRTMKQPKIGAGYGVVSRVVNPIGEAIDGDVKINPDVEVNIEKNAPGIIERKPVREPLETGIKFIDSMIPIGCGQRELIIGDKKTGKTAIAIDTIINQKGNDIVCIYVAVGQKKSSIAKVHKVLREKQCMDYTIIVAASASDSAALQYLAPYSGCALGEFFRDANRKVVIIYDDLSKHAVAYRQMSLLLRRPPGREGYPGDVFYIHSRLLERAAKLRDLVDSESNISIEGGSLTALPIIETIQGDVSAYIPTNVISITDGQIFLEASLFNQGIRPAINPGISVSRVGSSAQNKVIKKLAGSLKLELAQYREMEEFARLGLSLDEASVNLLEKGRRLVQLLNQPHSNPVSMITQIILLFGGLNGFFSDINLDWISIFERKVMYLLNEFDFSSIFNIIGREEMPEDISSFFINLVKVYLSNEDSIFN